MHTEFAGYYKLIVRRPDGRPRLTAPWFPNLITNTGLNNIGTSPYSLFSYISVGNGNAPPTIFDNQLASRIATSIQYPPAGINDTGGFVDGDRPYRYFTNIRRFSDGSAAGNITEIGAGNTSNGLSLFSRALVLDQNGNPTAITVLPDETLDVYYSLRMYIPAEDTFGSVVINGQTHQWTARVAAANGLSIGSLTSTASPLSYANPIGDTYLHTPPGVSSGIDASRAAYIQDSFRIKRTLTAGLTQANYPTGLRSVLLRTSIGTTSTHMAGYQIQFDPPIMKTNEDILTIEFENSWGRLEEEG